MKKNIFILIALMSFILSGCVPKADGIAFTEYKTDKESSDTKANVYIYHSDQQLNPNALSIYTIKDGNTTYWDELKQGGFLNKKFNSGSLTFLSKYNASSIGTRPRNPNIATSYLEVGQDYCFKFYHRAGLAYPELSQVTMDLCYAELASKKLSSGETPDTLYKLKPLKDTKEALGRIYIGQATYDFTNFIGSKKDSTNIYVEALWHDLIGLRIQSESYFAIINSQVVLKEVSAMDILLPIYTKEVVNNLFIKSMTTFNGKNIGLNVALEYSLFDILFQVNTDVSYYYQDEINENLVRKDFQPNFSIGYKY
jgi:hypothetical protein